MKLMLVLEHHFVLDVNNNIWTQRVVDYQFIERYLQSFNHVYIFARCTKINSIGQGLRVDGPNVSIIPIEDFKGMKGLMKNYFKIRKTFKQSLSKVDRVILRAPSPISFILYKKCYKKIPFALEVASNADLFFVKDDMISKLLNKISDGVLRDMCKKANGVSYVTKYALQKKYPCKALKEGNSNKYFTNYYSTINLKDEDYSKKDWDLAVKEKELKIVHTSYMENDGKGHKTLIDVMYRLKQQDYNVHLTFIGDGSKRVEFENLVKEAHLENDITFAGLIENKQDVLNTIKQNHLFILPSFSEGLPRSVIEAMAQNLACLSSEVGGILELLKPELLFDHKDVDGFENAIIKFISDPQYVVECANQNYEVALEYHEKNLNKRRKDFYDNLVLVKKVS